MVKIGNVDEFNRIKESEFGFILVSKNGECAIHKPQCTKITAEDFIDSIKSDSPFSYHWFSTVALIEKEFSEIKSCDVCNPD